MKLLFLIFYFILLVGQMNAFGLSCRTDEVNPLNLLKSSLTIKANIYFGDEDEEAFPITKTDFYLLDKSLVNILKDSGFKPEFEDGKQHKLEEEDYLTATAKAFSSDDDESALITFLIKEKLSKHKLFVVKTDYSGRADIKALKTGDYYLFGFSKTNDEIFVWHLPIKIKSGRNVIEIDQHNADAVFLQMNNLYEISSIRGKI